MSKELSRAKEFFLTNVDEDTRADNEAKIREWEDNIVKNEAYIDWQSHDITTEINTLLKDHYIDATLTLARNRVLEEEDRYRLWAKQDACLFLLSLTSRNAKSELENILKEIRHTISSATN